MKHDKLTQLILDKTDLGVDEYGYILDSDGNRIETIRGDFVKINDLGSIGTAVFHDDIFPDEVREYINNL